MNDRELKIRILMSAMGNAAGPIKNLAQASSKAKRDIREQEKALRDLQRTSARVESYDKLRGAMGQTHATWRKARTEARRLAAEVAGVEKPTRAQTRALAAANRESEKARQTYQLQTQRLRTLRNEVREAGASTRRLAAYQTELNMKLVGANRALERQREGLDRLGQAQNRAYAAQARAGKMRDASGRLAMGGAIAVGAGAAIASPVLGGRGQANELETRLTDIAQKADLGRAAARNMGRELIALSPKVNQAAVDLAAGVDVLAGMGLDPRQAMRAIGPIARVATAYRAEMADVSASSYAAIDNLKVPVEQLTRVLDIQAYAGKAGAFELRDMAQYFPALTASYQRLGRGGVRSVADLAAALQITRKGAGDASSAATNLENVLQKINAPQTIKAFEKAGVNLPAAMKRAAEAGKDPLEAIAEITRDTLGGDISRLGFLFQDSEVQKGLTSLIQNLDEYRRIRDGAMAAGGVVDADFAERLKDGAEAARQLQVNTQRLQIQLAVGVLPTINNLVRFAGDVAEAIGSWAARHPRLAGLLAKGVLLVGALVAGVGALALIAAAILAPLAALTLVAGALGITVGAIAFPVLAVVAVLGILGVAAYRVYTQWDHTKKRFAEILEWFKGLPALMVEIGKAALDGMIAGMKSRIAPLVALVQMAGQLLPKGMKQALGIRSPSRVFAAIGLDTMAGLALGLDRGRARPRARLGRTAAAMAGGFGLVVTPAAAGVQCGGPPAGPGRGPPPASPPIAITIHIHNPGPGVDGQALGSQVAGAVQRALGGAGGPSRRSFGNDTDGD
ncbi:phage tail tape measure protein [Phenylobacterium sp.]|uniref:phage tail tape measure protein n=1 Tax=Phenylobacterium sp. TaxID=1871053 RepID=UPI00301BA31A